MRKTLWRLLRSEDGATTAEYGFLIVLCTGTALAALLLLDQSVQTLADKARERMGEVDAGAPAAAAPSSPADPGRPGRGWGRSGAPRWGGGGNSAGGNPPIP